jgi:hypothetical protein
MENQKKLKFRARMEKDGEKDAGSGIQKYNIYLVEDDGNKESLYGNMEIFDVKSKYASNGSYYTDATITMKQHGEKYYIALLDSLLQMSKDKQFSEVKIINFFWGGDNNEFIKIIKEYEIDFLIDIKYFKIIINFYELLNEESVKKVMNIALKMQYELERNPEIDNFDKANGVNSCVRTT